MALTGQGEATRMPQRVRASVPCGPDWLHEIKYDGYRLRLERDGDRVRLITKGGYNWTDRYPWIVEAARKVRPPPLAPPTLRCIFRRSMPARAVRQES
jgi:ATP-dependent DNA ligase